MIKTLVNVPAAAKRGEIVEVKAIAMHAMENGLRRDMDGKAVPRLILNRFICRYNGEIVIDCDWHTGVAPNPFMSFPVKAADSGTLDFEWTEDGGAVYRQSAPIKVA